ncbi:MAG: hypothetical protein ACM4D3_02190 [Candidatus Sericytochromatia bacterium]
MADWRAGPDNYGGQGSQPGNQGPWGPYEPQPTMGGYPPYGGTKTGVATVFLSGTADLTSSPPKVSI